MVFDLTQIIHDFVDRFPAPGGIFLLRLQLAEGLNKLVLELSLLLLLIFLEAGLDLGELV